MPDGCCRTWLFNVRLTSRMRFLWRWILIFFDSFRIRLSVNMRNQIFSVQAYIALTCLWVAWLFLFLRDSPREGGGKKKVWLIRWRLNFQGRMVNFLSMTRRLTLINFVTASSFNHKFKIYKWPKTMCNL